jgi:transketolase
MTSQTEHISTSDPKSDEAVLKDMRRDIFRMMHYSKSSHIGGCLSCLETIYALYFRVMDCALIKERSPDRDIFILSKGHCSAALYVALARAGFFPRGHLDGYYIDGGILPGHLDMSATNGVECSAGSLGHGASIGLGMAIAKERDGRGGRVYVLLGDGECNEGSVWEAVMLAATLKQKNYTLIVDFNHLQGMGRDVIDQRNLGERFAAFGFLVSEADGHDVNAMAAALSDGRGPLAIIARTVKGRGVSFTEDRLEWHYKSPNDEQLKLALEELR